MYIYIYSIYIHDYLFLFLSLCYSSLLFVLHLYWHLGAWMFLSLLGNQSLDAYKLQGPVDEVTLNLRLPWNVRVTCQGSLGPNAFLGMCGDFMKTDQRKLSSLDLRLVYRSAIRHMGNSIRQVLMSNPVKPSRTDAKHWCLEPFFNTRIKFRLNPCDNVDSIISFYSKMTEIFKSMTIYICFNDLLRGFQCFQPFFSFSFPGSEVSGSQPKPSRNRRSKLSAPEGCSASTVRRNTKKTPRIFVAWGQG